ncbi:hypothetical protein ACH5RR_036915 [Cinchona calisaya]|uniref:Uncharacterized protein n=1 Tax=Cinchona calisaya TaxID=153742 RepID=A0ABD2Y6X2_9GENT
MELRSSSHGEDYLAITSDKGGSHSSFLLQLFWVFVAANKYRNHFTRVVHCSSHITFSLGCQSFLPTSKGGHDNINRRGWDHFFFLKHSCKFLLLSSPDCAYMESSSINIELMSGGDVNNIFLSL